MPSGDACIVARDVFRRYGHRWVVRGVSLEVPRREVLLLIGGNGAGKTTLLRLMAGLLRPSRGAIERRGPIGMVAHSTMLYDALTARENLLFFGRLHGVADRRRADALLERMGLLHVAAERIATFSRGMLQRLSIARALLHEPEILLLDEPLTGLDDAAARTVVEVIRELETRGAGLVVATHQLVELVGLAASVGYMVGGRLAALERFGGQTAENVLTRYRQLVADAAT
jgi:heme exporter protein A